MDLEATSVIALDVPRRVSRVSFCYYADEEARALSVRRIDRSAAFDDLGRPVPGGLYDPALGPTSFAAGACPTCGLSYTTCPGHFGHIELPVPLLHPLLLRHLAKLLRAACWSCGQIKMLRRRKALILARLRFEHAGEPECARFVADYRLAVSEAERAKPAAGTSLEDFSETKAMAKRSLDAILANIPRPLARTLRDVDRADEMEMDAAISRAAKKAWDKAFRDQTLVEDLGPGWAEDADEILLLKSSRTSCPCCTAKVLELSLGRHGAFFFGKRSSPEALLSPKEIQDHLRKLWTNEKDIFDLLFGLKGRAVRRGQPPLDYTMFFVHTVLVPPSRFRPAASLSEGMSTEHPQNIFYQRMLTTIEELISMFQPEQGLDAPANSPSESEHVKRKRTASPYKSDPPGRSTKAVSAQRVADIQRALIELYDCAGDERGGGASGIRQQLESKEGIFRMHMMGKRVNFSCRSVIGPDVFLDTNEVGIPESFAKLLTVPEPVTPHNLEQLRAAVMNGPDVYPGANAVEDWSRGGSLQSVKLRSSENKRQLEAQARLLARNTYVDGHSQRQRGPEADADISDLARSDISSETPLPKRVLRHIRDGDVVLFNRQPTLHRVSIMAHKVRVLPGDRTIRFHYANCNSYNADFDGDEMNVHVPQDELARAEAHQLMLSDRHYIVPTSGSPVRGLIQDHILAAALISKRGTFLTRSDFAQLLYAATERIMSGSTGLGVARFKMPIPAIVKPSPLWTGKQLMSAVLDTVRDGRPGINLSARARMKSDLIGPEESTVVFRDGELIQGILDKNAFGASRFGIVHAVQEVYGNEAAGNFLSAVGRLCTFFLRKRGFSTGVDDLMLEQAAERERAASLSSKIEPISRYATMSVQRSFGCEEPEAVVSSLRSDPPKIRECHAIVERLLCTSGDVAQGRLDAEMTSRLNAVASDVNRCIPSKLVKPFPWNGFSLMTDTGAKGSVVNSCQISCLVGSTIIEGQRVPRMGGSGSTLPCFAPYDASANAGGFIASRFLTGLAPHEFFFHTLAGREGLLDTSLKTANSGYLQRCLVKHLEGVRLHYDSTVRDSDGSVLQMVYGDDGVDACKASWLFDRLQWQIDNASALSCRFGLGRGPVEAETSLHRHLNSLPSLPSQQLSNLYRNEVKEILKTVSRANRKGLEKFLTWRYVSSAVEPGDAVGIVAAQSVGEPSTQMTLNTFHHAGSESKHVTMGIPRLRELLMTSSKYPHTPSMTLPVLSHLGRAGAQKLSLRLQNVSVADLLERIEIKERGTCFMAMLGGVAVRRLGIVLHFPLESLYKDELGFDFSQLQEKIEKELVARLHDRCWKELRKIGTSAAIQGVAAMRKTPKGPGQSEQDEPTEGPALANGDLMMEDMAEEEAIAPALELSDKGRRDDALEELRDSDVDSGSENDETSGDSGVEGEPGEDMSGSSSDDEEVEEGREVKETATKSRDEITDEAAAAIAAWRDSKRAEIEAQEKAKQIAKSTGKRVRSAVKNKPDPKQKPARVRSISSPTEDGDHVPEEMENSELQWTSSLGKAGEIVVGDDYRSVELPWILPQEVAGRIRIGSLVREAAQDVKLASIDRITRCFIEEVVEQGTTAYAVATEGSNLQAALNLGDGLVDFNRVFTNDMFGILRYYGVEAMRSALVAEFQKIFGAYGIPVNVRHLALIADYMTARGGYRGFNRGAMVDVPSTFQQMSFETSMTFLSKAVLSGRSDTVARGPSAAIAIGEPYSGGTGSFELHVPIS